MCSYFTICVIAVVKWYPAEVFTFQACLNSWKEKQQKSEMHCLSLHVFQEFSNSNLICLYGLHERCLNNLVSRFNEGLIKDFYK